MVIQGRIQRINSLDSVRGIAALVVILTHYYGIVPEFHADQIWVFNYTPLGFLISGRFSVFIFFVLSGFVLSLPFMAAKQDYCQYAIRRICRIWLPFAFAVLLSAALYEYCSLSTPSWNPKSYGWPSSLSPSLLFTHLIMSGVNIDSVSLDNPMWSLIIEMRVSLIFPMLFMFLNRAGWIGLATIVITGAVAIKLSAFLGCYENVYTSYNVVGSIFLTIYYLPLFALGVMIALRRNQLKLLLLRIPTSLQLGIVTLLVILHPFIKGHYTLADAYYGLMAGYPILCCFVYPRLENVLSLKPFEWLGKVSYSMYLIHSPIKRAVEYAMPGIPMYLVLILAFFIVMVASALMHAYIEKPSMALGKKLAAKLDRSA